MRYFVLLIVIITATIFLVVGKIAGWINKNPKAITGTNPIGAGPIIKWGAKKEAWLSIKGRKWLGRYVQSHHPRFFLRLKKIF